MSKKLFLTMMAVLLYIVSASAQDIILKRDASEIEAKVLEISDTEVRYKLWSNLEGPTRVMKIADVFRIKYSNGDIEVFNQISEVSSAGDGTVAGGYNVGDIYDKDGILGIVVHTTDGGRHGLILHPQISKVAADYEYWCANSVEDIGIGMNDENDGMRNLMVLRDYIESGVNSKVTWDRYPVFAACHDLGEGWYVPAINELEHIVKFMCGGDSGRITDLGMKEFTEQMEALGGYKYAYYYKLFSSTERTPDEVYGYSKEVMSNAGYGWFATVNYGYEKTALGKHYNNGTFFYVHRF